MEKLTSETYEMCYQPTLLDSIDVISSPGSASGITPLTSRDSMDRSGQDHALASLSARQAKEKGLMTSGTYGPRSSISSQSADLSLSLANRLRASTERLGSTLFTLTWKVSDTPSGRPIFRLRASGRRISASDISGWLTPTVEDYKTDGPVALARIRTVEARTCDKRLRNMVTLAHWDKTPSASDGEGGIMQIRPGTTGKYKLRDFAQLAGWPNCDDPNNATRASGQFKSLTRDAQTASQEGFGLTWNGSTATIHPVPSGARLNPAFFPLADGTPGRVALLRGIGNAISPWPAKAFIESYLDG